MSNKIARLPSSPLTDQEIAAMHEISERTGLHGFPKTAQRMREVLGRRMSTTKTCSCGKGHELIPADARHSDDPYLGGYYWECSCRSTLFAPERRVEVA